VGLLHKVGGRVFTGSGAPSGEGGTLSRSSIIAIEEEGRKKVKLQRKNLLYRTKSHPRRSSSTTGRGGKREESALFFHICR